MRRPGGVDRRRRAAAASRTARDRQGHHRAPQVRLSVHQRAADGEEARSSTSRTRSSSGRCISMATRRCTTSRCVRPGSTTARSPRSRPRRRAASASTSTARCSIVADARAGRRILRSRDGRSASTASRCRPATPTSARPTSSTSSTAQTTKNLFRDIFSRGRGGRKWSFSQSALFLDFLAGNQTYHCTPWGNPTRTVFGWQRPCYLLGEGYAKTFKELMEDTDWDAYGTGNYEKCADCMVHSGYEATAVKNAISQSAQGARRHAARHPHRGRDGARNRARPPAAGAIRVLSPRRAEAHRNPQGQGRDESEAADRRLIAAAEVPATIAAPTGNIKPVFFVVFAERT